MAAIFGEWPSLENQVIDSQIFMEFPSPRGPRVKIFRGPGALYPFLTQKERMEMIREAEELKTGKGGLAPKREEGHYRSREEDKKSIERHGKEKRFEERKRRVAMEESALGNVEVPRVGMVGSEDEWKVIRRKNNGKRTKVKKKKNNEGKQIPRDSIQLHNRWDIRI